MEKGERGLLFSLDQTSDMLIEDMQDFGWDPKEAIEAGNLSILSGSLRIYRLRPVMNMS
ncbi:MAG: hypothetical protein JW779_15665 [Candidatus Thorarchaeota archaeon]|nr:hypothetical protein [Candidatus Thorarchaeota archaeon]